MPAPFAMQSNPQTGLLFLPFFSPQPFVLSPNSLVLFFYLFILLNFHFATYKLPPLVDWPVFGPKPIQPFPVLSFFGIPRGFRIVPLLLFREQRHGLQKTRNQRKQQLSVAVPTANRLQLLLQILRQRLAGIFLQPRHLLAQLLKGRTDLF